MGEHRQRPQPVTLPRRVIDWATVAGLLFEWAIAIGEYVFSVLVFGLVGGYFGTFADFGLSFVNDDWVGRGRAWGWVLGAAAAAVGLPLGWARIGGKRFSFPSPRSLRKKVSAGIRQRRKKQTRTHEFRNIGDVLKGGGVLALIGAVVGFFLGGALAICWFSLTMSPFSPAEWFESIDFGAKRELDIHLPRHGGDRHSAISANHSLLLYLWFSPVLLLGVLGAVVGSLYGAAGYLRYVTSTPAAVRERQRHQARQPVVNEAEAIAAAIEQRLPVLAPPPRSVPQRARWQLLRNGLGLGVVLGALFFAAGLAFVPLLVLGWRDNPTEAPPVAVMFAFIFLGVGLGLMTICLRVFRRKVTILRRGYVARCQIVECKDPQSDKWRPYETMLEELRAVWDKPIALVTNQVTTKYRFELLGAARDKTVTNADMKSFQRFAKFGGWFALLVFTFMGVVGVFLTGGMIYLAIVQREPLAWFGAFFMAAWWILIVWMARMFFRQVQLLKDLGTQSLKTLRIEPVVECRARFTLPAGKVVDFQTKLDLSVKLAAVHAESDDLAVYDPLEPTNALLLSGFRPALEVGETGHWQIARN